jgi:hypothetical protein
VRKLIIITARIGVLTRADFICANPASCCAPIQTNSAMNNRKGFQNNPTKPNPKAMNCPRRAAMFVARA